VAILATNAMVATRRPRPVGLPRWFVVLTALFFGAMVIYALARAMRL
jgi:hypothetical protein